MLITSFQSFWKTDSYLEWLKNIFDFPFQSNRPDSHRRKWDRDEFEKKAKEREDEEREKRRDYAKDMNDAAAARASAKYEDSDDDWDALDEDWEGVHKKSRY